MVVINYAYTELVNPSGATPVLSREQVWKCLQLKIRQPQDYVPVIEACTVLEENGNEVVREARFKANGTQAAQTVKEVCRSFHPSKVDFIQPSGAVITNIISDGENFADEELMLTYTFENRYDEVAEGSERAKELAAGLRNLAKGSVHHSIQTMRKMAAAGEL